MNETLSNKIEIFGEIFEFLSKMLNISSKVFKKLVWILENMAEKYQNISKKILKTQLLPVLKFEKVADNKARFECTYM